MSTFPETTAYCADFELVAPGDVNRRRHERYPVSGTVLVFRSEDAQPSFGSLQDISASGVLIRTEEFLFRGTRVRLLFGADGGYDLDAEVVRTTRPSSDWPDEVGVALQFASELSSARVRVEPDAR